MSNSTKEDELENAEAMTAFLAIMDEFRNHGSGKVQRELRKFAMEFGWDVLLGLDDEATFVARTRFLHIHSNQIDYSAHRREQLAAFVPGYYVYSAGSCDHPLHKAFDRLARPSSDSLWHDFIPPNGWLCRCRIAAGRSTGSVRRFEGDLTKALPSWLEGSLHGGRMPSIDLGFEGNKVPSMRDALEAVRAGRADD